MKTKLTVLAFLFVLFSLSAHSQNNQIISGTTNFSVKFIFGTCNGTFDAPKGIVKFKETDLENSSFDLTIPVESFKSGMARRDKDMKSDDYFDMTKYPNIHFKSTKISKKDGAYEVTGIMHIKDVKKEITLPVTAEKQSDGSTLLKSTFMINRLDYKVGGKTKKMKDEVTLDMTLQISTI